MIAQKNGQGREIIVSLYDDVDFFKKVAETITGGMKPPVDINEAMAPKSADPLIVGNVAAIKNKVKLLSTKFADLHIKLVEVLNSSGLSTVERNRLKGYCIAISQVLYRMHMKKYYDGTLLKLEKLEKIYGE
ncbi:MAG: hypothetical protein ABIH00_03735 [Armatimonadota bacterium]